MTTQYVLHYAPDNASLIIRLTLEELGVAYETTLVDRANGGQSSPDYLRLNPNGLIPVLETPQGPIFETGAILLWLADRHKALAPAPDHPHRAAFLKWLFFTSNTLHADLRMLFYPQKYVGPTASAQAALYETLHTRLKTHLRLLDDLAAQAPGWFAPTSVSVLHFYVACLMRWMALYPISGDRNWFCLTRTPHLRDLLLTLQQRPAIIAAQQAEGLGSAPFTAPVYATPSKGSAL